MVEFRCSAFELIPVMFFFYLHHAYQPSNLFPPVNVAQLMEPSVCQVNCGSQAGEMLRAAGGQQIGASGYILSTDHLSESVCVCV